MTHGVDVVVVGGGVAGLVAAWRLSADRRVVLLEADDRLGGKLRTGTLVDRPLDLGPDAFLTRRPAAVRLCEELGLAHQLVAPAAGGAALYVRGRLRPLPAGLALGVPTDLAALARSGVVAPADVLRAALDLVLPGTAAPAGLLEGLEAGGPDPTIAEVVGRRLGAGVLDALAGPLLGGINAGDPARLSFAAAAPSLAALAAGRRSLLLALRPAAVPTARPAAEGSGPSQRPPLFLGLRQGLGTLAGALEVACRAGGVACRTGTPVTGLSRVGDRFEVTTGEESFQAAGVVLATPAHVAARLLSACCPPAGQALAQIPYASVATCTLAWPVDAVPARLRQDLAALAAPPGPGGQDAGGRARLLPGSGFLVARGPHGHDGLVTAATFTSTKWPHSVPPGLVALRASVGRHGDDRHCHLDDGALAAAVAGELAEMTGIRAAPVEAVVQRWPDSFPQQVSGHRARLARARAALAEATPGIVLAGAAYEGIGIPACIDSAQAAAAALADARGG